MVTLPAYAVQREFACTRFAGGEVPHAFKATPRHSPHLQLWDTEANQGQQYEEAGEALGIVAQLMPNLRSVEVDLQRHDHLELLPLRSLEQLKRLSLTTSFSLARNVTHEVGPFALNPVMTLGCG